MLFSQESAQRDTGMHNLSSMPGGESQYMDPVQPKSILSNGGRNQNENGWKTAGTNQRLLSSNHDTKEAKFLPPTFGE